MTTPWRDGVRQVDTIARATFAGFLESDLMPGGMQAPALIWAAAFLVAPALFFPAQYIAKYPLLRHYFPAKVEGALWDDRVLFLLMSAGAMGLVSVVLWDTLFPARRDAFVLTPLPVAVSIQMLGRLGGLVLLALAFAAALNLMPSFTFPFTSAARFGEMPRWIAAHLISTCAADAFVFFSITTLQGVVILVFGRRAAARLAALAQTATVLILLLTLLYIDPIRHVVQLAILRGNPSDPVLQYLPPAWFLGLYNWIAGTSRPLMTGLALRGALAAALPFACTVAIYAVGYERLLARAVEAPPRSSRSGLVRIASRVVRTLFVRRPEEQAISSFVLRAISCSGRHSMLMSIYIGVGLAFIVTAVMPDLLRYGSLAITEPRVAMLTPPLILSAALAVGVRILMTIPADMPARWVFQTTTLHPRRIDAAVHKTLLLIVLPPVVALAGISAWMLWGPAIAWRHALYCGALAYFLCELLLLRFRGVPLTRPYVAGRSQFHLLWAFYLSAFLVYTYSAAALELTLFDPDATLLFTESGIIAGVGFALWAARKAKVRGWDDVPFEADLPDETFSGFNLSEIYAAQSVSTAPPRAEGAANPKPRAPV